MATSKNTGDTVNRGDVNPNLKNDTLVTKQRYQGLANIWNNPDAGGDYSAAYRQNKFASVTDPFDAAGVPAPSAGTTIAASQINAAATVITGFASDTNNLTGSAIGGVAAVSAGNTINSAHINNLITTINAVLARYDAYNSYFDGSNLCARSCQVACQTACQTSCQGCNTSQCHNQKCGAH
jgi:hypothetical protein